MSRTLPILCSASVVRNLLSGAQTEDRRPIRELRPLADGSPSYPQYHLREMESDHRGALLHVHNGAGGGFWSSAPWSPGDVLYVRETWMDRDGDGRIIYAADIDHRGKCPVAEADGSRLWITPKGPWRPSIHMKKEHARIHLRVLSVGVERVGDITEDSAKAEGCVSGMTAPNEYGGIDELTAKGAFGRLWDSLYGTGAFTGNGWCWVTRFERVSGE